uniref:CKK domain-containing protein n=2 Tax=Mesocestoides corti TaxID=53468 RepID=A0A5K3F3F3_MESCO
CRNPQLNKNDINTSKNNLIGPYKTFNNVSQGPFIFTEDLCINNGEKKRFWLKSQMVVIEFILRIWIQANISRPCIAHSLRLLTNNHVKILLNEELEGADGVLFWLVAVSAQALTNFGILNCQDWLLEYLNGQKISSKAKNDDTIYTAIKRSDTFLQGLAIPNLIALALCQIFSEFSYHKEFRFTFNANGESSVSDTLYNISKLIDICSCQIGQSRILVCLPVNFIEESMAVSGSGIPCRDFACGLANASTLRRLQAAAVATEIFQVAKTKVLPCEERFAGDGKQTYRLATSPAAFPRFESGPDCSRNEEEPSKESNHTNEVECQSHQVPPTDKTDSLKWHLTTSSPRSMRPKIKRNKALDAFFTESAGQSTRSCLCESPSRFQNNPSNLIQSTSKEREGVQIEGENHFNQEAFGNLSVGLLEARKGSALMLTTGTVDQSLKSEGIPLVKSSQTTWHDRPVNQDQCCDKQTETDTLPDVNFNYNQFILRRILNSTKQLLNRRKKVEQREQTCRRRRSSSSVDLADELSPMSLSEDVTISSVSAASVSDSCCESISVDCVDILRSHQTPECTASGMTRQRESEEQNCVVDAAQAISNCINAENEHFHITPESFIASQEAPKEDIKSESSECNASEECPKVNCVVSDKKARFSSEYKHHEVGQIRSGGVKSALPGVTRHITAIKAEGSTGIAPECAQRAQDCSDTCPRGKRLSQEHLTKPKNTRSYVEAFEGRINPLAGTSANAKHTVSQKDAHRVCLTEDVTCCRRPTSCLLSPTGKTTPSPQLHVKPTVRSNRRTIMNAILHRCLVGRVQEALKLEVLQELGSTDGSHFVILLKNGQQYSGLFLLNNEVLTRITGVGPRQITTQMVEHFYKYDSGTKSFVEIELTKHLSTAVDAVALMVSHNRKLT